MKILIVDDEENIRLILENVFADEGYEVETAGDGLQAMEAMKRFRPEIALLDKNMPRMDGLKTLQQIRKYYPATVAVMITAHGDVGSAVEAMKSGAYDYVEKPFDNAKMLLLMKRAGERYRLQAEVANLRDAVNEKFSFHSIIGNSPALKRALDRAASVCETDATVLLTGESGTGKELFAKAIHFNSPRRKGPLVTLNCGAIPLQLMESELFGHEKGAFTDAKELKIGRFEQAAGGTLFLDEVGELPLDAQVKLLRVLEDKKITRVGGKKEIPVDIRLVSATNNNLHERVQNNSFRLDLFYRLNIFTVHIPPLRERKEDIPSLVEHFIGKHNPQLRTGTTGCSREALAELCAYAWPGNIRDLENAVQSAMIICKSGKLQPDHLPMRLYRKDADTEPERDAIVDALRKQRYNKTETAEMLGISRKTLFNKMRKYGL
ncbi:MAG: sigma-54 dependent transcriptional regulator [Bacteroidales bacterium]|jgi:DNA-binding NtrC family response regulator|nr:sigma-54 dependent transcriptional regulator [Bacteroidales bacterium]